MRRAVVVLAAGVGRRAGLGRNKALHDVAGRPLVAWSVRTAIAASDRPVVVVCAANETGAITAALQGHVDLDRVETVMGGDTRYASERAGILHLADEVAAGALDVIAVHDGARPMADAALFDETLAVAAEDGAAVPAVSWPGLADRAGLRTGVVGVQTPQAFDAAMLVDAYMDEAGGGTDTASTFARRHPEATVTAVTGSLRNLKVTFADDFDVAERLLSRG